MRMMKFVFIYDSPFLNPNLPKVLTLIWQQKPSIDGTFGKTCKK